MTFRTKLHIGFGTILFLFVIFSLIVLRVLFVLNVNINESMSDHYAQVKLATTIRGNIDNMAIEATEMLLDKDLALLEHRVTSVLERKSVLTLELDQLKRIASDEPEVKALVGNIILLQDLLSKSIDQIVFTLRNEGTEAAIHLHNEETEPLRVQLFEVLEQFSRLQENDLESVTVQSGVTYVFAVRAILIMLGFTLLCGFIISTGAFRSLTRSLNQIISVMGEATMGEDKLKLPKIPVSTQDELGSIGKVYNRLAESLEEHTAQELHYKSILELKSWKKTKVAEITSQFQLANDMATLTELFISEVCPAMEAGYGVVYVKDRLSGRQRLVKTASYAGNNEDIGAQSFFLGEGMVGQCALDGKVINLHNPPKDYIQIASGLGSSPPQHLLLVPVTFESETIAVVEIASIHTFNEIQEQLMTDILSTFGMAINSVEKHMKVQQLLEESQIFAEELQSQSEEMQLQQEELRTLNEQLEEKNKQILQASGYKSEFLANMSHELRTPLNSLLILSQMLAENRDENLTPKQIEFIRTIYSSGSELLKLINEVLDLTKVESGKIELVWESVRLKDIIDYAERQFFPISTQRGIAFEVQLDEDLADVSIYMDIQRLQQIVKNLLSNAFKFTQQGSVYIRIASASKEQVMEYSSFAGKEALAIIVGDTGIGISEQNKAMIFDAFQQADGTTSRRFGGTGLGLSISQKIAILLGGFIHVNSVEGQGSVFTVYLPFYKDEPAATEYRNEAAAAVEVMKPSPDVTNRTERSTQSKKILLVDDDMRNIYALTTVLEANNLEVIFAENGKEGLKLLKMHPDVDLILMDIMMPKMDGYEAIRQIRNMAQHEKLPIIALTAKAMKNDRDKCIEVGANDYISKPVDLDQLLSLVRVWLHR